MADLDTDSIKNLFEEMSRYGSMFGSHTEAMTEFQKVMKDSRKTVAEKMAAEDKYRLATQKLTESLKSHKVKSDQIVEHLKDLDEAIENASTTAEKTALQEKRKLVENTAISKKMGEINKSLPSSLFTKAVAGTALLGASAGAFAKSLQSGGTDTAAATSMMAGAVGAAGDAGSKAGQGLAAAGTAAAMVKGPIGHVGKAAIVAGTGLDIFSSSLSKTLKFGIEYLGKEVEKSSEAFKTLSTVGATFSNGMTGMRDAAHGAGVDTATFAKNVKENAGVLSESGMGVAEASKKSGRVLSDVANRDLRPKLQNLGFALEEHMGVVSEVMAMNRVAGREKSVSDKEVAVQTADYAKNLRVISGITGEDAKKKMEEAKKMSTQVAFRAKLQELEKTQPGITQKWIQGTSLMTKEAQQAAMEQIVFGNTVTESSSVIKATSGAMAESINGTVSNLFDSTKTVDDMNMTNAAASDKFRNELATGTMKYLGMAAMTGKASGAISAAAQAGANQIALGDRISKEGLRNVIDSTNAQGETQDQLTQNLLAADRAIMDMKVQLEIISGTALPAFTDATKDFVEFIRKQTKEFVEDTTPTPGESRGDKAAKKMGKVTGGAVGGIAAGIAGGLGGKVLGTVAGTVLGALVGSLAGPAGTAIGAKVGGVVGATAGIALGSWFAGQAGAEVGESIGEKVGPGIGHGISSFLGNEPPEVAIDVKPTDASAESKTTTGKVSSSTIEEFANGGIASGSPSGFLAKLHGTELVIPMNGNNFDTESDGYKDLTKYLGMASMTGAASTLKLDQPKDTSFTAMTLPESTPDPQLTATLDRLTISIDKFSSIPFEQLISDLKLSGPMSIDFAAISDSLSMTIGDRLDAVDFKSIGDSISMTIGDQLDKVDKKSVSTFLSALGPLGKVTDSLITTITNKDKDVDSVVASMNEQNIRASEAFRASDTKKDDTVVTNQVIDRVATLLPVGAESLSVNFEKYIEEIKSTVGNKNGEITATLSNIQKWMQQDISKQGDSVTIETGQPVINQQLLTEIAKMNVLLSQQIKLSEESNSFNRQILDATNDHKSISSKIFNATI